MTPEIAKILRAPFPPEAIGKLPKVNCGACIKANKDRPGSTCEKHVKRKCETCGAWISAAHIHLDYVGHAAVRDRLLQADPEWTWEPVAIDPNGAPALANGGLWIRMTVAGVSRLGWGDGPDVKQMISDAIRNAAMTFGVALDLWSKEDLHAIQQDAEGAGSLGKSGLSNEMHPAASSAISTRESNESTPAANGSESSSPSVAPSQDVVAQATIARLKARAMALQADGLDLLKIRTIWNLPALNECTSKQLELWQEMLTDEEKKLTAPFDLTPTVDLIDTETAFRS